MNNITKAYQLISKETNNHPQSGYKKDFITQSDDEAFDLFARLGYIKCGVDSEFNERWSTTHFGKKQAEIFLKTNSLNKKSKIFYEIFGS